jgi:hypothetical protein
VLTFTVTFSYDFFSINKDSLAFLASVGMEKIQTPIYSSAAGGDQRIALPGGSTIKAPF